MVCKNEGIVDRGIAHCSGSCCPEPCVCRAGISLGLGRTGAPRYRIGRVPVLCIRYSASTPAASGKNRLDSVSFESDPCRG